MAEDSKVEDAETQAAAVAARDGDPAADTRRWLLEVGAATLCTTTAKDGLDGWPMGSVVPFATDATGRPFVLLAGIAQHTRNLKADNRASIFVRERDKDDDPQTSWRVSLLGRMTRLLPRAEGPDERGLADIVDDDEWAELHARYKERVPGTDVYLGTHDFSFWRMNHIETVRYIAGFGRICWIPGADVLREPLGAGLLDAAAGAVKHMNEDHQDGMQVICQRQLGVTPDEVELLSIDRSGMLMRTPQRLVHESFGHEIDAAGLRAAVVDAVKRAREAGASG